MAQRIEIFTVTVPSGTALSTPQTTSMGMNPGIVERIEILVPPGPSGLVGFQVRHSGDTVIPHDSTKWIISDNERIDWRVEGYPEGNAWAFRAYNTDVYNHTFYLRFHVNETQRSSGDRITLVPIPPLSFAEDIS